MAVEASSIPRNREPIALQVKYQDKSYAAKIYTIRPSVNGWLLDIMTFLSSVLPRKNNIFYSYDYTGVKQNKRFLLQ